MIVVQPGFGFSLKGRDLFRRVFLPTEALLADGQIKSFYKGLLVLLIGACDTMVVSRRGDEPGELGLKLGAAIGLDQLAVTKDSHEDFESGLAILSRQLRSQDNPPFASENIHRCKGKYASEVKRVHLDDRARPACLGQRASRYVPAPFGPQLQMLIHA